MKTKIFYLLCLTTLLGITACNQPAKETTEEPYGNPAAEGFNAAESDVQAIAVADEVMEAMGGRKAWDETHYVCWKFFGRDELVWDKWTGNVRIDRPNGMTLLSNIHEGTGKAFMNGREITDADSVTNLMETAKRIWINHSYWLVMPFKLKDSGVTLKYLGADTTQDGKSADKLMMTFQEVGVTPNNKYEVWVDEGTRLVSQWAFYQTFETDTPRFVNPWVEYNKHGNVMLSTSRGRGKMEDIMVFEELPESVFTSPEKPDLKAMMQ